MLPSLGLDQTHWDHWVPYGPLGSARSVRVTSHLLASPGQCPAGIRDTAAETSAGTKDRYWGRV